MAAPAQYEHATVIVLLELDEPLLLIASVVVQP